MNEREWADSGLATTGWATVKAAVAIHILLLVVARPVERVLNNPDGA